MHTRFKLSSYFAIILTLALVLGSAKIAMAQSKQQIARECLALLTNGETEKAAEIAEQIMLWDNVFAPRVIEDGESCLNKSTDEFWEYFSTKSGFLFGDAARAEQAFIDGAKERRAQKESDLQQRLCKVTMQEIRVLELQALSERVRAERQLETRLATWVVCADRYALDKETTLFEPVCNALFLTEGLPDSPHAFDYVELQMAQLRLLQAQAELAELSEGESASNTTKNQLEDQCGAFSKQVLTNP